jgi:glycine/D-amino acid oxidase-like deaminating enzyme
LDVPFRVFGAVRLDDQVVLHPGRYTQGLAAAVLARSGVVFENSRVVHVRDGSPCVIRTAHGSVLADRVVVATHYPVLDDGEYLARLEPTRGCCVAIRLRSGTPPRGLAISAGRPSWSLSHSGELLVLAGSGHPGVGGESYPYLESFARAHFDVAEVTHRWSAQDSASSDHLPVIGAHTPGSRTVFVAAGFRKWGLSAGTAAAMILRDLLVDVPNPWADPLSPNRLR